jgi:hypothetical protein
VSRAPGEAIYDPDLDTPYRSPAMEAESVAESQRLIANPSLVFLLWLLAYMVIRHALIGHHLGLFWLGLLLAIIPLPLGQFHCLDCGATGWALRAARHICPAVTARCHGQIVSWIRIPRLRTQFKIWVCVVILALLLYAILSGHP